ncbi:hypothetical protein EI94DRAFT_798714 [Lactarius quietus]|nr:hypothetical protein EI94DRAFT_798714 [Lactarius quietus]
MLTIHPLLIPFLPASVCICTTHSSVSECMCHSDHHYNTILAYSPNYPTPIPAPGAYPYTAPFAALNTSLSACAKRTRPTSSMLHKGYGIQNTTSGVFFGTTDTLGNRG